MVDHLKDLQEMAHDMLPHGGISEDTVNYIDSRVRLREFRERLAVITEMNGDAIRTLRSRYHLSQTMLAELVNMSVVTVSKWERGEKKPNGAALRVLNVLSVKGPGVFTG